MTNPSSETGMAPVWISSAPQSWPLPPHIMSVSRLLDIEGCPRRWALTAATYPEIWNKAGYPLRANKTAIAGRIVHLALERITKALVSDNCVSATAPLFVATMRKLGGFSVVIDQTITEALASYEDNPRVAHTLGALDGWFRTKAPYFREQIQRITQRFRLVARRDSAMHANGALMSPAAIETGSHAEVTLSARTIDWIGVADLLILSPSECEIIDFKTGEPKPDHAFQMYVYSLLWLRDSDRNPHQRPATRLTLSYPAGDVAVKPFDHAGVNALERELQERTRAAIDAVLESPPAARPSSEACRFCQARHLCDTYWEPATQLSLAKELGVEVDSIETFTDLEVNVTERLGESSWNGFVSVSRSLRFGAAVRLLVPPRETILQQIFATHRKIRILNATIYRNVDGGAIGDDIPLVSLSSSSEAFLVADRN
jgi:hypothetical protein